MRKRGKDAKRRCSRTSGRPGDLFFFFLKDSSRLMQGEVTKLKRKEGQRKREETRR